MKFNKNKNNTNPSLYGVHAVREAWLNDARTVHALYITQSTLRGFENVILEGTNKGLRRPHPTIVDKNKISKMLPKGAVHQGIALACSSLEEMDERDLAIRLHQKKRSVIAMLDQVTDPHNVGAILRSASAFGIDGVVIQKKHAPSLDGVLAKTACGAVDHIPVAKATNLKRALEELQAAGFVAAGLDERGETVIGPLETMVQDIQPNFKKTTVKPLGVHHEEKNTQISQKVILVLGSEGAGIRHLVKETCDGLVKLPTQGSISSLNVSNAAAIAFYALMNR